MIKIVFLRKSINTDEVGYRVRTQDILLEEYLEFAVVCGTLYLAIHVCKLLSEITTCYSYQELHGLDDRVNVLFFFELNLLSWCESNHCFNVVHK